MRDSLKASHSTERCKIKNKIAHEQIFHHFLMVFAVFCLKNRNVSDFV